MQNTLQKKAWPHNNSTLKSHRKASHVFRKSFSIQNMIYIKTIPYRIDF